MPLNSVVPLLTVPDIGQAVRFYVDVLGFYCANQMEGWACVEKDGVEVMFALPNEHIPIDKPQLTGSIYFKSDDVDSLWKLLKDKATVVYPIENFDYGMREFAIRDINGYCLQFGQPID
jgi:uncharacterized glyoxalase superfamily protein PhnB